jgi:8-oxo-dGTP pyrophosphatase MutT (NUDIX family)
VIGGILDPGEQPADCVVREVLEETGVVVVPERLTSVTVSPMTHYPNGDQAQYLDLTFRCRPVSGEARVNDEESLEVTWFAPADFPELDEYTRLRVGQALANGPEAAFARNHGA